MASFKTPAWWTHTPNFFGNFGYDVYPDARTENWPLMDFRHAFTVASAYVIFVIFSLLFLKGAPPMKLKTYSIIHNLAMTIYNLYMVIEIVRQVYLYMPGIYGEIDRSERGLGLASVLWCFYVSKVFEFNDTFIMVMKQNFRQITFLHVYHHAFVFLVWWVDIRFYPGGEAWPSAFGNSLVHVFMYSHYLFASLGYSTPWKKLLTKFQMVQLAMFTVQGITLLFNPSPFFAIGVFNGFFALTILILFANFYIQSYLNKDKKKSA